MFEKIQDKICEWVLAYIEKPLRHYEPFSLGDPETLRATLEPGDVLLVEGNQRISAIIKYLTQSTWSHMAFYVGESVGLTADGGEPASLIEAGAKDGVVAVPLSKYASFNTRICRPVGLSDGDRRKVTDFMIAALGLAYDTRNITDLMRYLFPLPPVPVRYRRRMLALGSGDPTRAICSSLIAQAFQSVRYPILPAITVAKPQALGDRSYTEKEILHIRHHSLYTPRDFDVSPYFRVIKPTLEGDFDYKALVWEDDATTTVPAEPAASAG